MAILGDLLVQGRSRFLQQIYAPGISIDGDTTVTGTLTLSKIQDAAGTANNSPALIVGGPVTSSHLEFDSNEIMAKATGTTTADLYINTDGGIIFLGKSGVKTQVQGNLQVQGTSTFTGAGTYSGNLTVNGTTSLKGTGITGDLTVSNNAKINGSLIVEDEIRTPKWIVDNIANLGGEFIIAPTIIGGDNVSVNVSAVSNGKYTITVTDSSITSSSFGGIAWSNGSIVKVSGTINDVVLVSINGTMTQTLNTTTNTIQFTVNSSDVTLTAGTYTGNKVKNLHIMMYKNAGIVPVGIFMTSYGESKYPYIDIYSGSSSGSSYSPTTRLGYLTGIKDENGNALTVNGVSPTGWGLYTNNGYFSGTIVSTSGKIGGFTIGTTDIHNGKTSRTETTNNGVWVGTDGIGFGKGITYFSTDGTGKIGPWTLSTTYLRNGNITGATNTSVAGVYLGTDGLNISNGTAATTTYITKTAVNVGNKLTWNGTTLTVTGTVNATAGYFGSNSTDGWSISSNAITHGTLGSSGGYILNAAGNSSATINGSSRNNLALAIGNKFGVGNDGTLYANGANITNINASNINAGTLNISYLPDTVKNENIEIGGRNLVRGTAFANSTDLSHWYKNQNLILSVEDGSLKIVGNQTSSTPGVYTLVSVNEGFCTVSFWYKAITSGGAILSGVGLWNNTTSVIQHNCNITIADTEWHYYSHTFELTLSQASSINRLYIFLHQANHEVTDGLYINRLKLEKGNRATDWSPAPEDMVSQTEFESAKSEIKATTDGITSTVSKISSAKYLETSYQYTLAGCLSYAAEGYSGSWTVTDTKDAKVGDTVYLKVKDTTRNCFIYIKGTVTNVNGNAVRCTSHGYEDVLPVNTIKSTINQSSDSVKIEARHVNIEGAAIFSSGRLSETSLNNAYDPKGAAQNAVSGAFDNRVSDSAEFLYRRTADGEDVPSGRATIQTIKGNTLRWNQLSSNNASTTISHGIIFTNNNDGSWTIDGEADSNSSKPFTNNIAIVPGHYYLVRGCPKNGSKDTYFLGMGGFVIDTGNGGIWQNTTYTTSNVRFDFKTGVSFDNVTIWPQLFDLTQMFGSGNEPATVAEFEALFPKPYYPYDAGSLLPVRMEGVETVGFNQIDLTKVHGVAHYNPSVGTVYESGTSDTATMTGENPCVITASSAWGGLSIISDELIPGENYLMEGKVSSDGTRVSVAVLDASYAVTRLLNNYSGGYNISNSFTPTATERYLVVSVSSSAVGTVTLTDFCLHLSDASRNGTYEPYWSSERAIPVSTYFPDGMRSAGSVYDELRADAAVTRVGAVDLGTLDWSSSSNYFYAPIQDKRIGLAADAANHLACAALSVSPTIVSSGNLANNSITEGYGSNSINLFAKASAYTTAAAFKTAMSGVMLHYALATPTTTPIDPPLNFVYKADPSGTEQILVDETKDAPQSSPVPMDITYGVNLYEDTLDDILNVSSRVSATEEAIAPLESKTYKGIIGTANDANGASFYFGNVFPVAYDGIWKVHLRINVTEPVLYQQNIDIMISGHKDAYMSFDSVVSRSSSALAVYFINLYRATQTGIGAGVGHALGFNLRASTNPTNASYKRTISVDVLDVDNCSVKLFDTAVTYDNLPSYNTTNYGTHSTSGSLTELGVATNGQNASNNGNTYDRTYHNNPIKAATAITAGHIICGTSAGYKNIAAGTTFDISYPLLYSPNAIAVNSTRSDTYSLIPSINFSNNGTIQSGVAYAQLYLKGTIVGNTFTIAASPFITTVVPTTEDGYFYIPMGIMSSATAGYFESSTAIYAFLDGKFRQVTPTEIVATHRVYYRTGTVNNSLAAPTTWVAEATGNVYNAWTTKIPPLSSGVSSTTKYPYLYTCEQRKRLDGTVECTKVLLDDSNTIIDGGTIITGSIAANRINASSGTFDTANIPDLSAAKITSGDISADRIKANVISAINSLTAGQIDADRINASQLSIGQSQVTNLTSDLADAKKHTQVIVSATNVDYAANTCNLTARLYVDGTLQTSTSLKWQWYRDGTAQGSQQTAATGTLAVTSSLGLAHRYACKCTF